MDMALAIAESFYEKPLAEVSCSFLARKVGLSKRWAVESVGALERAPDTIVVRQRGHWQGRVKSKYAMVLTPEDLGPKDAAELGVTGPIASDELWVNKGSPNITTSPKLREGEVVADAALAADAARPRGDDTASDGGVAPVDARAMAAAFKRFCQAYPRKEGFSPARKEFEAAVARDVSVDAIVEGAERYAVAKADVDQHWIKMPATWLRECCWTEDPKPPRSKSESKRKKANGKAAPAEPDDDGEYETLEQAAAEEAGFPIGALVWDKRQIDHRGKVLGVETYDDGSFHVWVWFESGCRVGMSPGELALKDPFTPEQKAEIAKHAAEVSAAAEAKRAKREAEAEEERKAEAARQARYAAACAKFAPTYRELLRRFPIGSRVDLLRGYDERYNGEVLRITPDCGDMEVLWEGETESSWVEDYNVKDLVPAGAAPDDDGDRNWWEQYGAEVTAP
jgi:hypothetical protein